MSSTSHLSASSRILDHSLSVGISSGDFSESVAWGFILGPSLQDLQVDSTFTAELPGDAEKKNSLRQVCVSGVKPIYRHVQLTREIPL